MKITLPRLLTAAIVLTLTAALILTLRPRPVRVELGTVDRGPVAVTILEDGKTRIKERFTVSAPLAGKLERMHWRAGDAVRAETDILALIMPSDPELLDPRARAQAEARVSGAEALKSQSGARLERARADHVYARSALDRMRKLQPARAVSSQDVEAAELAEITAGHALREAEFAAQVAAFELEQARAVLLRAGTRPDPGSRYEIRPPVAGSILRVFEESSTVVAPGTKLVELGDPRELEIVADVLSTDAVRMKPGARVGIENWGGEKTLTGRVRLIEPSAFTKISALGVEEQRVNVIIDFVSPPEERLALGDGFRVEVRLTLWEGPEVLRVPAGALFREGDQWAVFAAENGRAVLRTVATGHRNDDHAEVLSGLNPGTRVILYPGDLIEEGSRIRP